jgi:Cu/Ag efflux pump CusA
MTALCSGLALMPIVIAEHRAGYEIEYSLAVVVLGGIISSTILTLLVRPVLLWLLART